MKFKAVGRIWNPNAINYGKGIDITDIETGKVYTQEEAEQAPKEIRSRLVNKGRIIGCWVVKRWRLVEDEI